MVSSFDGTCQPGTMSIVAPDTGSLNRTTVNTYDRLGWLRTDDIKVAGNKRKGVIVDYGLTPWASDTQANRPGKCISSEH